MGLLIGDVFRNGGRAVPDRVAAVVGTETLTFADLDRRSTQLARALAADFGVARGDRVAAPGESTLETLVLFAAVAKLGAVFVPFNPGLTEAERRAVLGVARPSLVAGPEVVGLAQDGEGQPFSSPQLEETDPQVVFFTSGSSGQPKGVVLSHRVNALRSHPGAMLEPRGALVCPFPLFHMAAWTLALQQWQARDRIVFVAPDAATICAAVRTNRATRLYGIPAVWRRILDHVDSGGHTVDLETIRFADTGTSATPPELLERIAGAVPAAALRVFYGSTEAGTVASLGPEDVHRKPGSCGVPGSWVDVRVETGGELWVRGPLLFDGYLDDPDATAAALVDGWYRTGDIADVDGDGYLSIVGRVGDVIRTGGETVAPAEVEAVLGEMEGVVDVAVVGLPDQQWGEVVCAVVVVRSGEAGPPVEALRAHCQGRLASHKHPRRVVVVDDIPRTATTGQVQRRLLVERLTA